MVVYYQENLIYTVGMKYRLETIPVIDAFKEDSECPLCILDDKAEKSYVRYFLGNSVMIPEIRVEVNKTGFCSDHLRKLFDAGEKQPLGLMVHTHLMSFIESLKKEQDRIGLHSGTKGGADRKLRSAVDSYISVLKNNNRSCMICERIEKRLKRYSFTILYLWKKEEEFREKLSSSRGFCFHHLIDVMEMGKEVLRGKLLGEWVNTILNLQDKNLRRLEGEILWYTQKFDCRNDDKPWGTSRDVLKRLIQKLSGVKLS